MASQVRVDLYPDGGLGRIKLWGNPTVQAAGVASVRWWNLLPAAAAAAAVRSCCASPGWAAALAAGRPYIDLDTIVAASDDLLHELDDEELAAALAAHPRIGERPTGAGAEAAASRREQAGVGADAELSAALETGNREYEQRFGHVYLVRATGRDGPELLALLRKRLTHTATQEATVVRRELAEITALRLLRLWVAG